MRSKSFTLDESSIRHKKEDIEDKYIGNGCVHHEVVNILIYLLID
jgi:hypothetical protein